MFSTLLIINSLNRTSGTPGDFEYTLNRSKFDIQSFRVNKITIPYSFYNVVLQTYKIDNNTFTMPAGSYTIYTLISTILSSVQTLYPSFNITYDSNTNKVTITNNLAFTAEFTQLNRILGFNNIASTLIATSVNTVNLNLTTNLYVNSRTLGLYINSFFLNKQANIIQSVPVNTNSFGYIIFNNQLETMFKVDSRNLQTIDIQILDDYGNVVDFNGQDVIIELELFSNYGFI